MAASGAGLPEGYERFEGTQSPNQQWVVCGPTQGQFDYSGSNFVLNSQTGEIFSAILGQVGRPNMNHMDIEARWTSDSQNLLWIVHQKWGPASVIFFQFQEDGTAIQIDLRKKAVTGILERLKEKFPSEYQTTKRENEVGSEYYPDGFTVDIRIAEKEPALPFEFHVGATSSPKRIPIEPAGTKQFWVDSFMIDGFITGKLEKDRTISWSGFETEKHGLEVNEVDRVDLRQPLKQLEQEVAARLTGKEKEKFLQDCSDWLEQVNESSADLGLTFSDYFSWLQETELIKLRIVTLGQLLK